MSASTAPASATQAPSAPFDPVAWRAQQALAPCDLFPFDATAVDPWTGDMRAGTGPLPATASPSDVCKDGPVSFSDLLPLYVPPVQELVTGLIERGVFTLFSGPGGSHKSRLAIQFGLCIASKTLVWGLPVQQATYVALSYEDHPDEVTRRTQAIARKLGLNLDQGQTLYWNLQSGPAIAVVTENGIVCTPFYWTLRERLLAIPGHKLVTVDSVYNAFDFRGKAKINEPSVKAAIELLNALCRETDCTMIGLFHPSQAGQDRGDASGWSVAWHNTPRARLSIAAVNDRDDTFQLKVEKRNNGRKGSPIELHWSDGILDNDKDASEFQAKNEGKAMLNRIVDLIKPSETEVTRAELASRMNHELDVSIRKAETDIGKCIRLGSFVKCETETGPRWLKAFTRSNGRTAPITIQISYSAPELSGKDWLPK